MRMQSSNSRNSCGSLFLSPDVRGIYAHSISDRSYSSWPRLGQIRITNVIAHTRRKLGQNLGCKTSRLSSRGCQKCRPPFGWDAIALPPFTDLRGIGPDLGSAGFLGWPEFDHGARSEE